MTAAYSSKPDKSTNIQAPQEVRYSNKIKYVILKGTRFFIRKSWQENEAQIVKILRKP